MRNSNKEEQKVNALVDQLIGDKSIILNSEMERAVLGAMMMYPDSYYEFANVLNHDCFTIQANKFVYDAIKETAVTDKPDIIQVTNKMRTKGYFQSLKEVYGSDHEFSSPAFLTQLTDEGSKVSSLKTCVRILLDFARRRMLMRMMVKGITLNNTSETGEEVLEHLNEGLLNIVSGSTDDEFVVQKELSDMLLGIEDDSGKNYIKSHIAELDEFIYGWERSDLVIIAGAPSMGKTALMLEIAKNNLLRKTPPAIFSLEMSTNQLLTRMIAVESGVSLSKIRKKKLTPEDWGKINETVGRFEKKPFNIDDKSRSLSKICNKIRRLHMKNGIELFIIDYLQLISTPTDRNGNREQEVAKITRALKELAGELGVVIVALSQINREAGKRDNKRPRLNDLRESGSIEQDADMVVFVYRADYYNIELQRPVQDVELIIAKGRNTGTGTIYLKYIPEYTKFVNRATAELYEQQKNPHLKDPGQSDQESQAPPGSSGNLY